MAHPVHRPRRLRRSAALRDMVRETRLSPTDFIYPLFVVEGRDVRRPISSMPGIFNLSLEHAVKEAKLAKSLGVPSVILFGIPDHKDARGTQAYATDGIVQRAIREIKAAEPDLQVIADVCLCEYTDHGHCGVLDGNHVANDATLPLLAQMAVTCAQAGADIIAPSDMMDGRIGAIRKALDEVKHQDTPIMAYSAKYASGFYGPFREAAQSTPQFGDRRGYQMDPGNVREAIRETALDVDEGADFIMVKPALSYLDVIRALRENFDLPLAAYNVSGEYAMLKAAGQNGWVDYERVMLEVLTSIKRAGADLVITYHALEAAKLL
ncbi:delta-aminolevulinic acid dehydratase [Corallococcus coralloides DSM 2259]|uniref:Delta-aminolevulinic acid dehydratase n=1 Tax=Corallococcus coralloides (strain ATCC 25202 / DSM 2259 / NBRC 100086 / M2) TaxID=1144275 RepID=H8MSG6_CORCM|nr:porphobilinogen synthase [Corallococcus coralloides]AFE09029.1 delta-aminolevulinic acid dehydratase [Corallococcus coralloides DSM 2259]